MHERIKSLRQNLKMTQQEFADKLHIKRGAVANYEVGRNIPTDSVVALICKEFDVSETWLRTGEGTMFVPQTPDAQIAAYVASTLKGSNEFKKAVLSLLLSRSDEELAVIERAYRDLGVMLAQRERQRSDPDAP